MEESNFDKVFPDKACGDEERLFMLSRGFVMFGEWEGIEQYGKNITLVVRRRIIQRQVKKIGSVKVYFSMDDGKWRATFVPSNFSDLERRSLSAVGDSPEEALRGIADGLAKIVEEEKTQMGDGWEEFEVV